MSSRPVWATQTLFPRKNNKENGKGKNFPSQIRFHQYIPHNTEHHANCETRIILIPNQLHISIFFNFINLNPYLILCRRIKLGQRAKCKHKIYKTSRRKIGRKFCSPQVKQKCLNLGIPLCWISSIFKTFALWKALASK